MAELKIPVVIDGVKSIEELANRVLDEYEYHGRTIREWADLISEIPPHGRMIDADALIEKVIAKYLVHERKGELVFAAAEIKQDIVDLISDAPTIIPAEEGE